MSAENVERDGGGNPISAYGVGDVVQIDPDHDHRFAACLLVVTELRPWGVQGYVTVPQYPRAREAYYRVPFKYVSRIGVAEWVHEGNENVAAESLAAPEQP